MRGVGGTDGGGGISWRRLAVEAGPCSAAAVLHTAGEDLQRRLNNYSYFLSPPDVRRGQVRRPGSSMPPPPRLQPPPHPPPTAPAQHPAPTCSSMHRCIHPPAGFPGQRRTPASIGKQAEQRAGGACGAGGGQRDVGAGRRARRQLWPPLLHLAQRHLAGRPAPPHQRRQAQHHFLPLRPLRQRYDTPGGCWRCAARLTPPPPPAVHCCCAAGVARRSPSHLAMRLLFAAHVGAGCGHHHSGVCL